MKKMFALFLAFSMFFIGCNTGAKTGDLMTDITPQDVISTYDDDIYTYITDFSANLFNRSVRENKNTLVSPVSILYVLAMIQNGAQGATLSQMQNTIGVDTESLNCFMAEFLKTAGDRVHIANGIWVKDGFKANKDFLQTNADYFGAGIYSAPFNMSTVKDINNFVNKNTDGMIDQIIDRLNPQTVMCLVNALTFDDKWAVEYEKSRITDNIFTNCDGTENNVKFMHSEEGIYLQDEDTTGFIKPYKNGDFSFVALLPDSDTDISRFCKTLTGKKIHNILNRPVYAHVNVFMPEFEAEYSQSMIDVLKKTGIIDLFTPGLSDLSAMGYSDNGLYISNFLHKTYISVNRQGTKAAAISFATADECRAAKPVMSYTIRLDRPFVYMILHNETGLPIFMGTITNIG